MKQEQRLSSLSVSQYCFDVIFFNSDHIIFAQGFDLFFFPLFHHPCSPQPFPSSLPPHRTRMNLQRACVAVVSVTWMETCPHLPTGRPSGQDKEAGALTHLSFEKDTGWGNREDKSNINSQQDQILLLVTSQV